MLHLSHSIINKQANNSARNLNAVVMEITGGKHAQPERSCIMLAITNQCFVLSVKKLDHKGQQR